MRWCRCQETHSWKRHSILETKWETFIFSHPQPTMLKKTLQCLEGIHLSQSGSLLMLYVDKLLSTPFRVLARMVDTLACRRVEMLLAETLQVQAFSCFWVKICKDLFVIRMGGSQCRYRSI